MEQPKKPKFSLNQKLTIFTVIVVASIIASPFVYAAVEPHITINMELGQTTKPFVINDDTGTEVFSVDVDGTITGSTVKIVTNGVLNVPERHYEDTFGKFFGQFGVQGIGTLLGDTEPAGASYTFTHTITSSDFPSGIEGFNFDTFTQFLSIQFINNDASDRILNVKYFINDVEIATTTRNINNGEFAIYAGEKSSEDVVVGDKIQVKAWSDVAGQMELNKVAIWIFPNQLTVTSARNSMLWDDNIDYLGVLDSNISITTERSPGTGNYKVNSDGNSNGPNLGFLQMNIFKGQFLQIFDNENFLVDRVDDLMFAPEVRFLGHYQTTT